MIFFGCAYAPWRGLDRVPAMKWAVLVNPLVNLIWVAGVLFVVGAPKGIIGLLRPRYRLRAGGQP